MSIPIPNTPSNPAGGDGANSTYYALPDSHTDGASTLAASTFDRLVNLLDNGLAAALAAVGAGTLVGGTFTYTSGLTLSLAAWRGILPQTADRDGYAGAMLPAQVVTVPANSTFVVWAVPLAGQYDADAAPYDTAESGLATVEVVLDGTTPDGGTPLLSGSASGTALSGLTDARVMNGIAGLVTQINAIVAQESADIAAVHTAIGTRYFGGTPPQALDTRVTALEGGGVDAAGSIFWDTLTRSVSDTATIADYVQAQLPAQQTPPTPTVLSDDVVVANSLKNSFGLLELYAAAQNNAAAEAFRATLLDTYLCRPGITDPGLIDMANSTCSINFLTGEIS